MPGRADLPGEPETEAGRRLLDYNNIPGNEEHGWVELPADEAHRFILAIEAEARAESSAEIERERSTAADTIAHYAIVAGEAHDLLGGMYSWNDAALDDPNNAHLWTIRAARALRELLGRPAIDRDRETPDDR